MIEKSLKSIEFDKITEQLSSLCVFDETRENALKLKPSRDYDFVKEELLKADVLYSYILKYSEPRLDSARGSLDRVVRAEKGAILTCGELLHIARMYRNFDRIKKWYFQYERIDSVLDWTVSTIYDNNRLEKAISEAILSDTQVADNASDELYDIRRKIKQTESAVRDKLDGIIKSSTYQKYLQEAVVTIRRNKFVVPVKSEYKNEVPGIVHDVSSSGSTFFVEPAVIADLNNKVMQLYNLEQEEINRIWLNFLGLWRQTPGLFKDSYGKLLEMDKYIARAKLAIKYNGVKPYINKNLKI